MNQFRLRVLTIASILFSCSVIANVSKHKNGIQVACKEIRDAHKDTKMMTFRILDHTAQLCGVCTKLTSKNKMLTTQLSSVTEKHKALESKVTQLEHKNAVLNKKLLLADEQVSQHANALAQERQKTSSLVSSVDEAKRKRDEYSKKLAALSEYEKTQQADTPSADDAPDAVDLMSTPTAG